MLGTRVTEEKASKVEKAIEDGFYLTTSAFLQGAIEKELKRLYPEDEL